MMGCSLSKDERNTFFPSTSASTSQSVTPNKMLSIQPNTSNNNCPESSDVPTTSSPSQDPPSNQNPLIPPFLQATNSQPAITFANASLPLPSSSSTTSSDLTVSQQNTSTSETYESQLYSKLQAIRKFEAITQDVQKGRLLNDVPLLSSIKQSYKEKLGALMKEIEFKPNDVVFKAGDVGEQFFIVVKGSFLLYNEENDSIVSNNPFSLSLQRTTEQNPSENENQDYFSTVDSRNAPKSHVQPQYVTRFVKNDFFGESALLMDLPRQGTVICAEHSILLSLHKSHFLDCVNALDLVFPYRKPIPLINQNQRFNGGSSSTYSTGQNGTYYDKSSLHDQHGQIHTHSNCTISTPTFHYDTRNTPITPSSQLSMSTIGHINALASNHAHNNDYITQSSPTSHLKPQLLEYPAPQPYHIPMTPSNNAQFAPDNTHHHQQHQQPIHSSSSSLLSSVQSVTDTIRPPPALVDHFDIYPILSTNLGNKTDATISSLYSSLSSNPLLQSLPKSTKIAIINKMTRLCVTPSTTVIKQHSAGRHLFIIEQGHCDVFINDAFVQKLQPWDCFGELSLLQRQPRAATVVTSTNHAASLLEQHNSPTESTIILWTIDAMKYREIVDSTYLSNKHLIESTLAQIPAFNSLTTYERLLLVQNIEVLHLSAKTVIFQQGEYAVDGLYVLVNGSVGIYHHGHNHGHDQTNESNVGNIQNTVETKSIALEYAGEYNHLGDIFGEKAYIALLDRFNETQIHSAASATTSPQYILSSTQSGPLDNLYDDNNTFRNKDTNSHITHTASCLSKIIESPNSNLQSPRQASPSNSAPISTSNTSDPSNTLVNHSSKLFPLDLTSPTHICATLANPLIAGPLTPNTLVQSLFNPTNGVANYTNCITPRLNPTTLHGLSKSPSSSGQSDPQSDPTYAHHKTTHIPNNENTQHIYHPYTKDDHLYTDFNTDWYISDRITNKYYYQLLLNTHSILKNLTSSATGAVEPTKPSSFSIHTRAASAITHSNTIVLRIRMMDVINLLYPIKHQLQFRYQPLHCITTPAILSSKSTTTPTDTTSTLSPSSYTQIFPSPFAATSLISNFERPATIVTPPQHLTQLHSLAQHPPSQQQQDQKQANPLTATPLSTSSTPSAPSTQENTLPLTTPTRLHQLEQEYKRKVDERHAHRRLSIHSQNISFAHLRIIAQLGTGAFGKVHLVKDVITNKTYALKSISKQKVHDTKQQEHVVNEKCLLELIHGHPFIVNLYATVRTPSLLHFVFEACLGGDLLTLLRKRKLFTETQARFYIGCICIALSYIHDKNIIYRDLKPENIVLDAKTGYAKLIDFGFAKQLADINTTRTKSICFTLDYLSPEMLLRQPYNHSVDIWALGVLMYELVAGYPPFYTFGSSNGDHQQMYSAILHAQIQYPSHFSPTFKHLINAMLVRNPLSRLGCSGVNGLYDIMSHEWFGQRSPPSSASGTSSNETASYANIFSWDQLKSLSLKPPFQPSSKVVLKKPQKDLNNYVQDSNNAQHLMKLCDLDQQYQFDQHFGTLHHNDYPDPWESF